MITIHSHHIDTQIMLPCIVLIIILPRSVESWNKKVFLFQYILKLEKKKQLEKACSFCCNSTNVPIMVLNMIISI